MAESIEDWIEVARLQDLRPGAIRRAQAKGLTLVLLNLDGVIYALDGICPHQMGPLWNGQFWQGQLECPWHHFRYDPVTGANTYPANVYPDDMPQLRSQIAPLRVFPVRLDGEAILVNLAPNEISSKR